jgi:hypothetical protein
MALRYRRLCCLSLQHLAALRVLLSTVPITVIMALCYGTAVAGGIHCGCYGFEGTVVLCRACLPSAVRHLCRCSRRGHGPVSMHAHRLMSNGDWWLARRNWYVSACKIDVNRGGIMMLRLWNLDAPHWHCAGLTCWPHNKSRNYPGAVQP